MATPNPYQESSAADHELVEFARSHGAELKGIGISSGVDGERGLVAERKVLPKETVLFSQGDEGTTFYIVFRGAVKAYVNDSPGAVDVRDGHDGKGRP